MKKVDMLQEVINVARDAIIVMNEKGKIVIWNPAAEIMLQYSEKEAVGQPLHELISPMDTRQDHWEKIKNFVKIGEGGLVGKTIDQKARRKDGELIDVQLSLSRIKFDSGWGSVGVLRDITFQRIKEKALRESREQYRQLSMTDQLTSLYNRLHFGCELVREVNRLKRYHQPLSIITFDIDNFKFFNDECGHVNGDKILEIIGKIIKEEVRSNDIPCRMGGDEFLIILPMTEKFIACEVAERISMQLKNVYLGFTERRISISVGVIQCEPDESVEELTRRVDNLMMHAKKTGKDKILF